MGYGTYQSGSMSSYGGDPRGEDNPYGGYANKSSGAGGYNNPAGGNQNNNNKITTTISPSASNINNVKTIFDTIFGREPNPEALAHYAQKMQNLGPAEVLKQISESPEAMQLKNQSTGMLSLMGSPSETNTYAAAPTQFTTSGTGTNYPDAVPDTMFTGIGSGLTGGLTNLMIDKAAEELGADNYLGGLLNAYSDFDPLGQFASQTMYGMNDEAKKEYARLELENPNWSSMSETDRVAMARSSQINDQLPNAYIQGSQNLTDSQLAALKPEGFPASQWDSLNSDMKLSLIGDSKNSTGAGFLSVSANAAAGGSPAGNSNGQGGLDILSLIGTGSTGATGATGGTGGTTGTGGAFTGTMFNGEYTGDAVNQLSQARSPRSMDFDSIYGTTSFNPATGQFDQQTSPEYNQFQQGLLGQLQGSQDAYQSFDPQDAASEYLRGVNALREPMREQQTDSKLSRLIQSGKLGSTVGTQALAQLETEQESQRFQEAMQAQQYGTQMQDRMLRNQAGMFGLTSQVAAEQFKPQQQALGSVPMLQQIYGFAQEPQFQQGLAEQGIGAQQSANNTANWMNLGTSVLGSDIGQDILGDGWSWLKSKL